MLVWLRQRRDRRRTARDLYGSIVTQARERAFYANWGVPDTTQGRFEIIVLHLVLVLRRLGLETARNQQLARALTEVFVIDMDDAMREMTIGDLAVPREVKRATGALLDRYNAYLAGLSEQHDMKLQAALESQLAYLEISPTDAAGLSRYTRTAAAALDQQPEREVLAGRLRWPPCVC
jgi:cytochrome b pre-mRNA-processing protein 3